MPFHQLEGVEVCQFKAREYLMRRGDPMPYVYYLKRGVVNREILSKERSILITTIKESGGITSSIVGLLEIFADYFEGKCTDDFVAVTDCVLSHSRAGVQGLYARTSGVARGNVGDVHQSV